MSSRLATKFDHSRTPFFRKFLLHRFKSSLEPPRTLLSRFLGLINTLHYYPFWHQTTFPHCIHYFLLVIISLVFPSFSKGSNSSPSVISYFKVEHMEGNVIEPKFKTVCVFCGSSEGKKDCYKDAAIELAQELVSKGMNLVYGGGSIGLMGLVSQAVHRGGCNVLGIIPKALMNEDITGKTVGREMPVADMHQRKAEMAKNSDCFVALPGGYGTLEELMEVITWAQLGLHDKPIGLLNVNGFYDSFLTFINKAVDDGFIKPSERNIFVHASNAKELLQKLEEYVPLKDRVITKAN